MLGLVVCIGLCNSTDECMLKLHEATSLFDQECLNGKLPARDLDS